LWGLEGQLQQARRKDDECPAGGIASRVVVARLELLREEQTLTRARDAVNTKRRLLPMVQVEKDYVFETSGGELRLAEIFDGRRQLVVYHAMWLDERGLACPSCSAFLDQIGHLAHLHARDTSFAAVSRAPIAAMESFKARMGWRFPWYSSRKSDFNYDFHASFDESKVAIEYNYVSKADIEASGASVSQGRQPFDLHGLSVFFRDGDTVFHT
jgi:predicted dithiol-disulfide oxidoreductase (DUF899 family)